MSFHEKRTKPLVIICQKSFKKTIQQVIDFGYRSAVKRAQFKIIYDEIEEIFAEYGIENPRIKTKSDEEEVEHKEDTINEEDQIKQKGVRQGKCEVVYPAFHFGYGTGPVRGQKLKGQKEKEPS